MSMAHAVTEVISRTGTGYQLPGWLVLLLGGGGLWLVHLVRALRTDDAQARLWMQVRGLSVDPRSVETTTYYLRRLRWSRVGTTGLLLGSCALAAAFIGSWISFVSLPFLLSVLLAEVLAPVPRRGRLRTALLLRRSRSFAPRWPLVAARVAIAAGVGLSLLGALHGNRFTGDAVLHGVVLIVGGCALEACLRTISLRSLPDREPDLSLDTAMRVASARTATAAALVFGVFGLLLALTYARISLDPLSSSLRPFVGLLLNLSVMAAVATAISLLQPLRSWRPRGTP